MSDDNAIDYSQLWDPTSDSDYARTMQALVNNGNAWKLEGTVGRTAMDMIGAGVLMLGKEAHYDYYGNKVPSRFELVAGSMGTEGYVRDHGNEPIEVE